MSLPLVHEVEQVLRWFVAIHPKRIRLALVGGIAVSARTEAASTTYAQFVVSLPSDLDPESYLSTLAERGFAETGRVGFLPAGTSLEDSEEVHLIPVQATVRQHRNGPGITLTFDACTTVNDEIVAGAEPIELANGLVTNVACVGDLIALMLQDQRPPLNRVDLATLSTFADDTQWERAAATVDLMKARGGAPGLNLMASLNLWRSKAKAGRDRDRT